MGFNVTNQVQKQVTDQYPASSCGSSEAAPAKAPSKDTFEKAPAKAAAASSSSSVACAPVPPAAAKAPAKAPVCSSSSHCAPDQAPARTPAKAPALSSSSSGVAPAKGVAEEQHAQACQAVSPDAYRARLNHDIEAAENPHGAHRAAVKDMRNLANQLICQQGTEAFYTARLQPLNVSHRRMVIEANHRAQQADAGQKPYEGSPVRSVPGGGVYAWAKAVYKETHSYKIHEPAYRAAAVQLIQSTLGLIEEAQVAGLGDHKWLLKHKCTQLKRHLRHLADTKSADGEACEKGVAQGEQCYQGQQAQGGQAKTKSSWRARLSKLFSRKKKTAPARGEAQIAKPQNDAKPVEQPAEKPQNEAKPVAPGPSSAQQSSAEIAPQQPIYQEAPAQQSSADMAPAPAPAPAGEVKPVSQEAAA